MKRKSTLKRVLCYIEGYRLYLLASILLAVLTVALTLYAPILTGDAIDYMIGKGAVDFAALLKLLTKLGVIIGATSVFQWIMNLCNNHITYKVVMDVRTEAFDHMQDLPLSYIDSHPQGDIVSRLIADIDQFSDGLLMGFTQLFTGVMTILGTLLFCFRSMWASHWWWSALRRCPFWWPALSPGGPTACSSFSLRPEESLPD